VPLGDLLNPFDHVEQDHVLVPSNISVVRIVDFGGECGSTFVEVVEQSCELGIGVA
jgi:hypothetical protein